MQSTYLLCSAYAGPVRVAPEVCGLCIRSTKMTSRSSGVPVIAPDLFILSPVELIRLRMGGGRIEGDGLFSEQVH